MLIMRFIVSIYSVSLLISGAGAVFAQNYPNKPIHIIAPEPGGPLEYAARQIAQAISPPLGQSVVVDNRLSALVAEMLSRAAPDGYTLAMAGAATWLTPLTQKTSYDTFKDFAPITLVSTFPFVLVVHPSLPAKSVKELVALAKAKPGMLNIGATNSPGGQSFLGAELFKSMTGVNMVRVPYKGNPSALVALLAGEVQLMFNDISSVAPHVKSGRLRALAVASLEPSPLAPGMPTLVASGLAGFEVIIAAGLLAPAGTPAAIVNRLNQEVVRALNRPDVREKFANVEIVGSTPEQFAAKIKSEVAKWGKVIKDAGVKVEL